MIKKFSISLFLVFILLAVSGLFNSLSAQEVSYERLFYFREGPNARKSFFAHPESIDVFAPQTYSVNEEGFLNGTVKPDLLDFAKKNKIKVMPLLTNGAFHATTSKTLLDDTAKQDILIKNLILEAKDFDYWGWQIDFEQMDVLYRDRFSKFIERIYKEFQMNNLKLSVAVISQFSEVPLDYPKNLWERIIGVYDYARLAQSSDFISLMSYDDPNSLGPVVGRLWLEKVIAFSLTKIPKEKVSLGIPFYYWRWDDAAMKRVGIGGNENIDNLMKEHNLKFGYSFDEQAPYFHYWDQGKSYTGWYENGRSIGYKISLLKKYNLRGFSAWALGLELPSVYGVMKN